MSLETPTNAEAYVINGNDFYNIPLNWQSLRPFRSFCMRAALRKERIIDHIGNVRAYPSSALNWLYSRIIFWCCGMCYGSIQRHSACYWFFRLNNLLEGLQAFADQQIR